MTTDERLHAIIKLGEVISSCKDEKLIELINTAYIYNPWFTENNVKFAIKALAECLTKDKVLRWHHSWENISPLTSAKQPEKVGIIMAGNIPLVGFHDMICVLASGNTCIIKSSSDDPVLITYMTKLLISIEPGFKDHIYFTKKLSGIDSVIATGSNNTSRYFEYYFGKYPHIIRKNRSSIAILNGKESKADLAILGNDIFQYFGLGCRNVSKIFIPREFDFKILLEAFEPFAYLQDHNKYANNYNYNKTMLLMNNIHHLDNGFLLVKEDAFMHSPIATLFYEYYSSEKELHEKINSCLNQIQCIVGSSSKFNATVKFGRTQFPELWDYADNVNTMEFLLKRDVQKFND